jgi:hypothetical protein
MTIKIYDAMVQEITGAFVLQETQAWKYRGGWKQIPFGQTGLVTFIGNIIIEDDFFWFYMPSRNCCGPDFIQPMAWPNVNGIPGEGNVIYNTAWDTSGGYFDYYQRSFNIIKNQADELIYIRDAGANPGKNIMQYRFKTRSGYIEMTPQTSARYDIGNHTGPHRFAVSPPPNENNNDWVFDPKDYPQTPYGGSIYDSPPKDHKYILWATFSGSQLYSSTFVAPKNPLTGDLKISAYRGGRDAQNSYLGIGTGRDSYVVKGTNNDVEYIAFINQRNVFMYEEPNSSISVSGSYTASFKPGIAGKWRVSGRVSGSWYTQTRDVQAGGNLIFTSPVSGTLQSVVMYLYDRNSTTPSNVNTPQDIYRSITGTGTIYTFTRQVVVSTVGGKVNGYKNGSIVGTATYNNPLTIELNDGDSWGAQTIPDTGYAYEKNCFTNLDTGAYACVTDGKDYSPITVSASGGSVLRYKIEYYFTGTCIPPTFNYDVSVI